MLRRGTAYVLLMLLAMLLAACGDAAQPTATAVAPTIAAPTATAAGPAAIQPTGRPAQPEVILATTTTQDSGLLDVLIPDFQARTGYHMKPVAVGSGQALKMGEEGNADVLLVHSPDAEQAFM